MGIYLPNPNASTVQQEDVRNFEVQQRWLYILFSLSLYQELVVQWSMLLHCSVKCIRSRVQPWLCSFFFLASPEILYFYFVLYNCNTFQRPFLHYIHGHLWPGSQSLRCLKCLSKSEDICQHLVSLTSLCSALRLDYVFLMTTPSSYWTQDIPRYTGCIA